MKVDAEQSKIARPMAARPKRFRSLASKFFIFTAALCFWVVATFLGYDLRQDTFNVSKGLLLCLVVLMVSAAIARFTIRLLARPLVLLRDGITAVRNGELKPLQVSRTGDEIEFLGDSFNGMIEALAASKEEIRQHQDLLEERIRQRTEELQETTIRAEAASSAKSEFLANMSHELRTPMNGVIGMIDLVMEGTLSAEQRERLETAHQCAYSLLSLVNDILDLSKIDAGKMELEKIPFDVRALTGDCVRSHLPRATQNRVELRCEIAADVPDVAIGDPLRVRQILANLVGNAVKFTSSGYIAVRLWSTAVDARAVTLHIEVRDTGQGIPLEKLPYIFDKFTQADSSVSRKHGGTGLGLAITRKLAQMFEGDITVESELGRGATFSVNLKCGIPAPSDAPGLSPVTSAIPTLNTGAARILVVEDNQVNQKVVTAVLRKRGFAIELANDGREAVAKLEAGDYDLILMDVQMPVLDGLEATRIIRRNPRWKSLPIVAMTAHAMNGDRERCLAAGMDGYVSKPVHPSHLLKVIDEYLSSSLQRSALSVQL